MQPKIVAYHFFMSGVTQTEDTDDFYQRNPGLRYRLNLTRSISEFIADGWQPFGAPFAYNDCICQALVKYAGIKPTKKDVQQADPDIARLLDD